MANMPWVQKKTERLAIESRIRGKLRGEIMKISLTAIVSVFAYKKLFSTNSADYLRPPMLFYKICMEVF